MVQFGADLVAGSLRRGRGRPAASRGLPRTPLMIYGSVIVPDVFPIAVQPWSVTLPEPLPVAPASAPVPPMIVSLMSRNCGFPETPGKQIAPWVPEFPGEVNAKPLG